MEVVSRANAGIEYLGFRRPEEVQELLMDCDACYLPQPFVHHLRELCRYSFPTKLTNYLALGRPVIVHAPGYGAVAPFLREHAVGAHIDSLEPTAIVAGLEGLLGDATARERASRHAHAAAQELFSDRSFQAAARELLCAAT
jgi:glycosyltransferase involved in cell wall biosynthesis